MAKFDEVYYALISNIAPPQDEWIEFINHCNTEFRMKLQRYNRPDLAKDYHFVSEQVQELMLQLSKSLKRGSFDPEYSTFKNYVDGIILNILRNFFDKDKKDMEYIGEESFEESFDSLINQQKNELNPEKLLLRKEYVRNIDKFIKSNLSELQYLVLRCRYLLGMNTEETANYLGKTKQQISRTKNKAITQLKEHIHEVKPKLINK